MIATKEWVVNFTRDPDCNVRTSSSHMPEMFVYAWMKLLADCQLQESDHPYSCEHFCRIDQNKGKGEECDLQGKTSWTNTRI